MSVRSARLFCVCVAASAALHMALLAGLPELAFRAPVEPPVLEAQLLVPERPTAAAPAPAPPRSPAIKRAATKPRPQPQSSAPPSEPASVPEAALPPTAAGPAWTDEEAATPAEPEAEAAATQVAETPQASPTEQATAPPERETEPPGQEPADSARPAAPQTGTIRYEVYYGSDRFSVGRSVQTWSIEEKSYRLTSFSETTGLVGLFKPYQYAYVAEGRVEPEGLRPEAFSVRRGRDGERQANARFDWDNRRLTYGRPSSPKSAPLNGRSYDLLTLFYQLARMPLEPGRLEFSVTTGTKYNQYTLEIGAEQPLELPIGTLLAIPIKQLRTPGEESMEVWLASEHRRLPVLIRFFDRDGELSAEQVATQIAVDTLAADAR